MITLFIFLFVVIASMGILIWATSQEELKSWVIYVPTEMNGKHIDPDYHQFWDNMVTQETGGLTIHNKARGKWFDQTTTITEEMIPVEIACTRTQIDKIVKFTASHYNQQAVMVKKISDEVIIYAKSAKTFT